MAGSGDATGHSTTAARIAVMRRLAALERHDAADIERAAEELGISTQRVTALLRAWRQHGRTRLVVGRLDKQPEAVAAAIAAAEGHLDLSGIREPYRVEVSRRIGVIGRHLRAGRSDGAAVIVSSREYGRNKSHFRNAVTAWVLTRDPTKLPGLSYMVEGGPGGHPVEPEVEAIMTDVLRQLGDTATVTTIHRRVLQLVGDAGLTYPSLQIMQDRLRRWRATPRKTSVDPSICLDRLALRPARGGRPLLVTLLFGGATGYVMGHAVTAGPPSASTDATVLARHLTRATPGARPAMLEMDLGDGAEWDAFASILGRAGVQTWSARPRRLRSGRLARASFGGRLPGLDMLRADTRNLRLMDPDGPVPPEALADVAASIDRHNAARRSDRPGLLSTREASLALAGELTEAYSTRDG